MIKRLLKQINVLLYVFLSLIIVFLSITIQYIYARSENNNFNSYVRNIVYTEGIERFFQKERFDNLEYCSFYRTEKSKPYNIVVNFLPDINEQQAKELYKEYQIRQRMTTGSPENLDHTAVWQQNHLVIFSKRSVTYNTIFASVIISVITLIILVVLMFISRQLSKLIIKPVIENEKKEKNFVASTSHELKTPLTIIKANIEMLEKEIGTNRRIEHIVSETKRMTTLVNNMMELNNLSKNSSHTEMSLSEAVLSIVLPFESVAYDAGKEFRINVENNVKITGNYNQIQSLVSILIDNAISYSFENSTIDITLYQKGVKCCFSVSNRGEEISKKDRELIFDRFYRRDKARQNNGNHFGLGLSIAKGIAEAHNTKIDITVENGINTFSIGFKNR